jgi:branched-chain amino acid transport system ATP-binding protein
MLEAAALDKSFGSVRAVAGVSLHVGRGARHALIGPNGAGKTTLFDLLSGECRADAGTVVIDGVAVTDAPPDARARAGLARSFQRNSLFPGLTVGENLALACAVRRGLTRVFWRNFRAFRWVRDAAEALAERVGLAAELETPARALAHGAQRQLDVALALAREPKVLLLDEPTAGMSPAETAAMVAVLGALPEALAVVVIEHDMDVVFGLAERITVLDRGAVLAEGMPEEVRRSARVRERYLGGAEP